MHANGCWVGIKNSHVEAEGIHRPQPNVCHLLCQCFFHDQKTVITIFRRTALALSVAHEKLAVKTSFYNVVMQRGGGGLET